MAKIFLTDIDLNQEELKNALLHLSAGIPSGAINGQVWYDTNTKQISYHNGNKAIQLVDPIDELNLGFSSKTDFSNGVVTGDFFFGSANAGVPTRSMTLIGGVGPCLRLDTGATTTGGVSLHGNLSLYPYSSRIYELGALIAIETVSDATNEYQIHFGLQTKQNATIDLSTDKHIMFIYARSVYSSHNFQVLTKDTSTTTTDTGVALTGSYAIFRLKLVFNGATEVKFYINDNLVATHTTNIPTADPLHPRIAIIKTAGTTARSMVIGNVWHRWRWNTRGTNV